MGALPENFMPAVQGQGSVITYRDIDLSIARAGVQFDVPGFSFFLAASECFDANGDITYGTTPGVMLMQLADLSATKLLVKSGVEFNVEPATRFYVTNPAQAGKMLRLYFATWPFMHQVPQLNASPSSQNSVPLGGSMFNNTMAGGGIVTALAPGANLTGILLRTISLWGTANSLSMFVGTAAPAGWNDTTKRRVAMSYNFVPYNGFPNLQIPAGQGIYFATGGGGADANCVFCGTYDTL